MIDVLETLIRACITMTVVVFATRVMDIAVLTAFWVLIGCAACIWLWLVFIEICERYADHKRDSYVPSAEDDNGQSNPGAKPDAGPSDDNDQSA